MGDYASIDQGNVMYHTFALVTGIDSRLRGRAVNGRLVHKTICARRINNTNFLTSTPTHPTRTQADPTLGTHVDLRRLRTARASA